MSQAHRFLHADGPGFTLPALRKMHPSEIALTLSADVLRLPYTPATRLVLAEIVSLHAATGCCDASNPHFMARLTLKHDVVNEAIQRLHDEGLVVKMVNKAAGFYRTLTPVPAAITAKAQANPYPEKPTSYSEKPTSPPSRESRLGQSEKPTTPSREKPLPLVGNPDTNTPFKLPVNFHQSSSTTPFGRGDAPAGPEVVKLPEVEELVEAEVLVPEATEPALAPKKKVAAKKKSPERPSRPEVPFEESELASYEAFEAAFADSDYALANLRYYHEKVKNWRERKTGEPPRRRDWKATVTQFFLNDVRDNSLKLAPGVQHQHASSHSDAVGSGAGPTGYRSARYDR